MTLDYFYGQAGELFSFFRILKALFQEQRFQNLSTDAKILYGILLDRMSLSAKNGLLDEQNRVFIIFTIEDVKRALCCADNKTTKLLRELEDIDLVERKRRGPGRPSLIYVKDFSSGLPKAQVQNCPNSNSGADEIAILEQPKPQANKTNKNNTEMSETKTIQEVSLQHLDTIPQSGVRRRRIWDDPTIPRDDVRLINSHYDDLYRVPNHGVILVDRSDGSSYTARVEHLDDYHFDLGEYGNVYHIAQFGEMIERSGSTAYPEIQTQDEQGAWELGGKGYLAVQSCEDGWDYTLYHSDYSVMDGGQIDAPELTVQEVREQILEAHHMEKGRRLLKDYDLIMDKVAEADELNLSGKPSTLEKLAALTKCDAPECNPTVCRKARDAHEL